MLRCAPRTWLAKSSKGMLAISLKLGTEFAPLPSILLKPCSLFFQPSRPKVSRLSRRKAHKIGVGGGGNPDWLNYAAFLKSFGSFPPLSSTGSLAVVQTGWR